LIERTKTGIPGLDELLNGGFIKGSVVLLCGEAGTGKTIFCSQFLYNGATQYGEKGVYLTSEEAPQHIKKSAALFGWDFDKLEAEGKVLIVPVKPFKVEEIPELVKKFKSEMDIQRLVVDSISLFVMYLENVYAARKVLYDLITLLQDLKITTIFTSEILSKEKGALSRAGIEEFVADAVILLENKVMGGQFRRALSIIKMRMSNHSKKIHPFEITNEGIKIVEI